MNFIKKIIDNWYFKRAIKYDKVGLAEDDVTWIKDHAIKINRITETMKAYILRETVHSLTLKDHERKKNWIDCLTALQKLSKNKDKVKMDYVTMKPKKTEA